MLHSRWIAENNISIFLYLNNISMKINNLYLSIVIACISGNNYVEYMSPLKMLHINRNIVQKLLNLITLFWLNACKNFKPCIRITSTVLSSGSAQ